MVTAPKPNDDRLHHPLQRTGRLLECATTRVYGVYDNMQKPAKPSFRTCAYFISFFII